MFKLNKKNFAVARAMVKGPDADQRLAYMHVNSNGSTVTDGLVVARVSLPEEAQPQTPYIYPKAEVEAARKKVGDSLIEPEGALPAETTAKFAVTNFDRLFPEPQDEVVNFTCNGQQLLTVLKTFLDVTEDADNCMRLRICRSPRLGTVLRIDSLAWPGKQSFCGVVKGVQYDGGHIAGEKDGNTPASSASEDIKQKPLPLPVTTGRKFRG